LPIIQSYLEPVRYDFGLSHRGKTPHQIRSYRLGHRSDKVFHRKFSKTISSLSEGPPFSILPDGPPFSFTMRRFIVLQKPPTDDLRTTMIHGPRFSMRHMICETHDPWSQVLLSIMTRETKTIMTHETKTMIRETKTMTHGPRFSMRHMRHMRQRR
jgi:hypothetical protein